MIDLELSEDERITLMHTAASTACWYEDPRYYQELSQSERAAGAARWRHIAHVLRPEGYSENVAPAPH